MRHILRTLAVVLSIWLMVSACGCGYQVVSASDMETKLSDAYSQGLADGLGEATDEPEPEPETQDDTTVYVTQYGYHRAGCQYLAYSARSACPRRRIQGMARAAFVSRDSNRTA